MVDEELGEGVGGQLAPADGFSSDTVYSLLADKRRRYMLHYLKQRGEPVPVREIATRGTGGRASSNT